MAGKPNRLLDIEGVTPPVPPAQDESATPAGENGRKNLVDLDELRWEKRKCLVCGEIILFTRSHDADKIIGTCQGVYGTVNVLAPAWLKMNLDGSPHVHAGESNDDLKGFKPLSEWGKAKLAIEHGTPAKKPDLVCEYMFGELVNSYDASTGKPVCIHCNGPHCSSDCDSLKVCPVCSEIDCDCAICVFCETSHTESQDCPEDYDGTGPATWGDNW